MRNKIFKFFGAIFSLAVIAFVVMAFSFADPRPNFMKQDLSEFNSISLHKIKSDYQKKGMLKSTVDFKLEPNDKNPKTFFGQVIHIEENSKIDKILIGITNNLISRIEVWNKDSLIKEKELGFVGKMTWGSIQNLSVEMYDQTNAKYEGESKIRLRFYEGTGFFGDIGNIEMNLTQYGDLSGEKKISLFSKSLDSTSIGSKANFSALRIWENWNSED